MIATMSRDGTLSIWDREKRQPTRQVRTHQGAGLSIDISSDSKLIAIGFSNGVVQVLNVKSKETVRQFSHYSPFGSAHPAKVFRVKFSPTNKELFTLAGDESVESIVGSKLVPYGTLWSVESGREISKFRGHERGPRTIDFNATGTRVVTAGDSTIRVWDVESGTDIIFFETGVPGNGNSIISSAIFGPNEKKIYASFFNVRPDRLVSYNIFSSTRDLVNFAKYTVGRCFTRQERAEHGLEVSIPNWCRELEKWPAVSADKHVDIGVQVIARLRGNIAPKMRNTGETCDKHPNMDPC